MIEIKTPPRPGKRVKKKREKPNCPACGTPMKRKGPKGRDYFKCPQCKGTLVDGKFTQKVDPSMLSEYNYQLKQKMKEISLRKLIRKLKKQKYYPVKVFRWEGKIINLDDYDKDGISFEEKKRMEEERKKQLEELEKKEKEKKENAEGNKE